MIVAMGVLVLMLVLAGQVFDLTVKSTGQATALVELNQSLRAFERTIREDLRNTHPGESLILVQGNPIRAYWTPDGVDADDDGNPANGYPHDPDPDREVAGGILQLPRADLLMLFTTRPGRSYVNPDIESNVQQVVYGHAELGEYVLDTDWRTGQPRYVFEPALTSGTMFPPAQANSPTAVFPASSWHLARRTVHLVATPVDQPGAVSWNTIHANFTGDGLGATELLESAVDVVSDFNYELLVQRDNVLQPTSEFPNNVDLQILPKWHLPVIFGQKGFVKQPFARSRMDVTPPPLYANRLGHYMLPNCASFKVEWTLNPRSDLVAGRLDGLDEILWIDPGHTDDPAGVMNQQKDDALASYEAKIALLPPAEAGAPPGPREKLISLLTASDIRADGNRNSLSDRVRSDAFPIADPVDDPDPWQPLTGALDGDASDHRANTQVFLATRPVRSKGATNPDPDNVVADDLYPTALRITIDVYDPQRRLGRPTRHVIIATVGG